MGYVLLSIDRAYQLSKRFYETYKLKRRDNSKHEVFKGIYQETKKGRHDNVGGTSGVSGTDY